MGEISNYITMREERIPLTKYKTYKKIRIIGGTGAGKSQFMRHLLDTEENGFPAVATGKCTVAKIEVITCVGDYSAVVTFYKKEFLESKVEELLHLINNAIFEKKYNYEKEELEEYLKRELYKQFRNISNQTFKLNFLLKFDDVKDILKNIYKKALTYIFTNNEDIEDMQSKFREEIKIFEKDILDLIFNKVNLILEELNTELNNQGLAENYNYILGEDNNYLGGGIYIHNIKEKQVFFEILKIFYDNNIKNQGCILNTIVEGIRILGDFTPDWYEGQQPYNFIFIDGIGLGHNPDDDRATEEEIREADSVIYLKDCKPQYEYEKEFVKACTANSWTEKVTFAFSHFDELLDNVELVASDFEERKEHVKNNFKEHIETLLKNSIVEIQNSNGTNEEKQLQIKSEEKRYNIFKEQLQNSSFAFTLKFDKIKLDVVQELDECYDMIKEEEFCKQQSNEFIILQQKERNVCQLTNKVILKYNEIDFIKGIFMGIKKYNAKWSEWKSRDGRSTWRTIEDLCYKHGHKGAYYCSLDLASLLSKGIIEGINAIIDAPRTTMDNSIVNQITEMITSNIADKINDVVYVRLYKSSRSKMTWQDAYDLKGYSSGSKLNFRKVCIDGINSNSTDGLSQALENPRRNIDVQDFFKNNELIEVILKQIKSGINIVVLKNDNNVEVDIEQYCYN